MVHDLLLSYGLLFSEKIQIAHSRIATDKEMEMFHTKDYLEFIKNVNTYDNASELDEKFAKYGLTYDCPLVENCYDFIKALAGGSVTAAKFLILESYGIALNWFGGWHHAQR